MLYPIQGSSAFFRDYQYYASLVCPAALPQDKPITLQLFAHGGDVSLIQIQGFENSAHSGIFLMGDQIQSNDGKWGQAKLLCNRRHNPFKGNPRLNKAGDDLQLKRAAFMRTIFHIPLSPQIRVVTSNRLEQRGQTTGWVPFLLGSRSVALQ